VNKRRSYLEKWLVKKKKKKKIKNIMTITSEALKLPEATNPIPCNIKMEHKI